MPPFIGTQSRKPSGSSSVSFDSTSGPPSATRMLGLMNRFLPAGAVPTVSVSTIVFVATSTT